ncbi:MAG: hypothetical protein GDA41_05105 [Rhodospirillales bacterium]|nr:hypothetical protein [Rhodospirillales bacterium]
MLDKLLDSSFWFTTWPALQNATGQPAISLPVHISEAGLPVGIQAVGRVGDEETLICFAAQMGTESGWTQRRARRLIGLEIWYVRDAKALFAIFSAAPFP